MTRLQSLLLVVVALEALVLGGICLQRMRMPRPPRPVLETFDPLAVQAIDRMRARTRPWISEDWLQLADVYAAHGFYPAAEVCYRQAAERAPENPLVRHQWALCLGQLGACEEAIEQFEIAIEKGHSDAAANDYFIGRNYLRLEQADAARAAFRRADLLPAARYELARLDVREGQAQAATAPLRKLADDYPRCFAPVWLLGNCERAAGSPLVADRLQRQASYLPRRIPTPFDDVSDHVYQTLGKYGVWALTERAQQQVAQGDLERAAATYREAGTYGWDPRVVDQGVDVLMERQQYSQAASELEALIARDGETVNRLWRLADSLAFSGKTAAAARTWQRAAEIGDFASAASLYGNLAAMEEQADNAAATQRYRRREYLCNGAASFWRNESQNAIPLLRQAVALDEASAAAWYYLGRSFEAQGKIAEARRALLKCQALDPFYRDIRAVLAGIPDAPDG